MNITITAAAVAWYGAIVATLGFGLAAYNVWRDRPRLTVRVREMCLTKDVKGFKADEPLLMIEVANIGREEMHPEMTWLEVRGQKSVLVAMGEWEPQQSVAVGRSIQMPIHKPDVPLSKIRRAVVRDETGRLWKSKRCRLT